MKLPARAAWELVGVVLAVIAIVIVVFFALGYLYGRLIL